MPQLPVPRSLTARLVATVTVLVAGIILLLAGATALAMNRYLTSQLDDQVDHAVDRAAMPRRPDYYRPPPDDGDADNRPQPGEHVYGQAADTIIGVRHGSSYGAVKLTNSGNQSLPVPVVDRLEKVPADGQVHAVDMPGDDYRVMVKESPSGDQFLVGLPTTSIKRATASLVAMSIPLALLGVLVAGLVGRFLIRRQLRPLRDVAATAHDVTEQQLVGGEPSIENRVPERLTDPRTEVGQVGFALNTMLDHVDSALVERHRSEQQVRQFVADASHELRTPLATINGYAQLSRRTPDDAGALSVAMAKVETEAHRMSTLVEDMLLLARLDSGRPLARDEVDVTRLLLEAVADARVVAPEHRWRLDLSQEPVTVLGDASRLHQVVTNLLNNARSHTPPGTTVTVGARADDREVTLTVHDDGPGLPPGLVEHAFERFTRGDTSRTRGSGGAGLGLSLVAAITAAHRGSARVSSSPGDTTFTLTLPLRAG